MTAPIGGCSTRCSTACTPDHPLRDDIAGTVESIAGLTPQTLCNCTKGFYAPSDMVLSVAGKITLEQAVEACKRNGLYRARAAHEVEWDIPADKASGPQGGPLHHAGHQALLRRGL